MNPRALRRIGHVGFYTTSSALAVLFLSPLVWSVVASLTGARSGENGSPAGFGNYVRLIQYGEGLGTYVWNSTVVTAVAVTGTLFVTITGGYALARFQFPGEDLLFLGALAILMIPHPTILVPLYTFLGWLGMQNSLVTVGLILTMFQLPFGLFLMRNAFEALPRELEEAALLDGCSPLTALWHVLLRATIPAIVTVAMFTFLAAWNEFMTPLIFLTQGSKFTLPIALVSLRSGEMGTIDLGALQAGVVVSAIPCLLIFILLQRHYVRGFTAGAVRG